MCALDAPRPDRHAEAVNGASAAEEPEDAEVDVYPFHMRIKGLPDLFHASCRKHPEFGMCGTEQEAEAAKAAHLATHEEPTR